MEADLKTRNFLNRELVKASPAECARILTEIDAEPWQPYRHLTYINDYLLRLTDPDDPIKRLLITIPYRHGKSYFCSTFLPIYYLNRYPDRRVIIASYSDEFAAKWGRDVRDLIDAHHDVLDIRVSRGSSAANQWAIDGHRGGMKTAGVGGGILGWGAHLFVVDDPHGTEDWASATERDNRWRWWNGPAHSRLEPGAAVCVIGTRWHEDDFIGRLLLEQKTVEEGGIWTHIHLPAIAEDNDPLGRHPGEALCPERFDINALTAIKESITPQAWLSGYQQRPTPEGGGRFQREHFRYWTYADDTDKPCYVLQNDGDRTLVPVEDCGRFVTMDTALSLKTSADYTVIGIWDVAAWLEPSRLILRDLIRTRLEGADHLALLQQVNDTHKPNWVGIEDTSLSMTLISQAQRAGLPVLRLKPEKDKYGRSESAVVALQNHRVYFPQKTTWYPDFEHELLSFPAGAHDDQVDAFSYAAREFMRGLGQKLRPKEPEDNSLEARMWRSLQKRVKRATVHPELGTWR